jgi:hypothetical protein
MIKGFPVGILWGLLKEYLVPNSIEHLNKNKFKTLTTFFNPMYPNI